MGNKYDLFISYKQKSGSHLAQIIKLLLEKENEKISIFLDVDNLENIHDLEDIIYNSSNLLLLITEGVFERKFVQLELETALKYKKNIITLWDKDSCPEFPKKDQIPNNISSILDIKAIIWSCEKDFKELIINNIINNIKNIKENSDLNKMNLNKNNFENLNINGLKSKGESKAKYFNNYVIIKEYGNFYDNKKEKEFMQELFFINALSRDNGILKCYGRIILDNIGYIVTEDLRNNNLTLYDYINNNKFTENQKMLVLSKIIKSVSTINDANIVLKYLNSKNILLDIDNNPKIVDLRYGKLSQMPTNNIISNIPDSIKWQAPEVFDPEKLSTFKSDVYSIAIIAWELITNKSPFYDIDDDDEIIDIKFDPEKIIKIFTINNHPLNEIIIKSLSPYQEKRPDLEELKSNIKKFMD